MMCFKKFRCKKCLLRHCNVSSHLNSASELLILHKTFPDIKIDSVSGLKAPSFTLMATASKSLYYCKQCFNKIAHKTRIVARLLKITRRLLSESTPTNNGCKDHESYLLFTLFRVLLYKQCKWTTASLKTVSIDKMRILHHV